MAFVITAPSLLQAAATDLVHVGSAINTANGAAAGATTQIASAGADEISAAIAALFSGHAQEYQQLSAQVAAFHDQFVGTLNAASGSYAAAEATNVNPLQSLLDVVNAPTMAALGRPLIGNGANGTPGSG
ncbi:PE family protein, partial [Mycobacterium sp.]|uniref:PE family protein n=1 Tax=Mycobacterium sp. TaxID=1785 RepID=UPI003C7552EA